MRSRQVLWLRDCHDVDQVRAAVEAWVVGYNEQGPLQALGYETPPECRAKKLGRPVPEFALPA